MNTWMLRGTFNETSLTENEDIYKHLNIKDITAADYMHTKRAFKEFEIKNIGEYHDLYAQIDTLLLADVFNNFQNMCVEIYKLCPARFLSVPVLEKNLDH